MGLRQGLVSLVRRGGIGAGFGKYGVYSGSWGGYKGDSRPRHLQGKRAYTGLVRQACFFLSLAPCDLTN